RWTWTPPENTVIEVAAVYGSTIVIGLSTINGNVIALLRLDFDDTYALSDASHQGFYKLIHFCGIIECTTTHTDFEFVIFDSSDLVPYPLCVVGTFKPSIKLLSLKPDNYLEMLHEELLVDYSIMNVNIPESACIIGSVEMPFFLV
ncbi:3482_t:CDS:2, partial [Racocetra persica]